MIIFLILMSQVRKIVIMIKSFSQRLKKFHQYHSQKFKPKSNSMQNVRIQGNSIYDMLFRTLYLRFQIHVFFHQKLNVKLQFLKLFLIEGEYICYLIYILKLFKTWIMIVSQINIINIIQIGMIFNDIFNITKTFIIDLKFRTNIDRVLQKLVSAIEKIKKKLTIYYGKTIDEFGGMYNFVCVLNSDQKLKIYDDVE